MKYIIFFIILGISIQAQNQEYREDLDNDGMQEVIKIYWDNTYYLMINEKKINLNTNLIKGILDQSGVKNFIVYDDINNDNRKEILINVSDNLFTNKSHLYAFSYSAQKIDTITFYANLDIQYSEIISMDGVVVYNYETKCIYVNTLKIFYNARNSETIFFDLVSLYYWDQTVKFMIKGGEKYFNHMDAISPIKRIF